eukprot:363873-Chlamydomonas_euryale.AAC.10
MNALALPAQQPRPGRRCGKQCGKAPSTSYGSASRGARIRPASHTPYSLYPSLSLGHAVATLAATAQAGMPSLRSVHRYHCAELSANYMVPGMPELNRQWAMPTCNSDSDCQTKRKMPTSERMQPGRSQALSGMTWEVAVVLVNTPI